MPDNHVHKLIVYVGFCLSFSNRFARFSNTRPTENTYRLNQSAVDSLATSYPPLAWWPKLFTVHRLASKKCVLDTDSGRLTTTTF